MTPDGLPAPQRYHAFGVIIFGIMITVLDSSIVNLALPDLSRDLDVSPSAAVWVVNGFQVAVLGTLLPLASLGERIGYRRVYLFGVVVFTLGALACLLSRSLPSLVVARAVQGLGAAGVMAVNSALLRLTMPADQLGRAIAVNSVTVATASVAGPTVAAAILSVASWPWLFALNLPLGALLFFFGMRSLPANPHAVRKGLPIAWVDAGLNVLMFSLLFLGADMLATRAKAAGAGGGMGTGALLLGAGVLVAFFYVRRQRRQALPLLPIDLLRIPVFALSMCTSVSAFAAHTLAFVALPFLLLQGHGLSHLQAGLLITAWPLAIVVSAPIAGRLMPHHHGGLLGGIGLGVMALGLALVALMPADASIADMAWRLAVCGAGFGFFQSPNNHTIVTSAPLARAGAASGMLGTARLTGQSLGAVLVAVVFSFRGATEGASIALGLAAAMSSIAAVFSASRLRAR
jgi:DHA2 family multidrug resistance protein-like MFS transporter